MSELKPFSKPQLAYIFASQGNQVRQCAIMAHLESTRHSGETRRALRDMAAKFYRQERRIRRTPIE